MLKYARPLSSHCAIYETPINAANKCYTSAITLTPQMQRSGDSLKLRRVMDELPDRTISKQCADYNQ